MTDRLSKSQRSYCMSRVKGKWTSQEITFHNFLKGNKIKHIMYPKLVGNPDILLKDVKSVIFVNGCFWHKCPKHYRQPASNKKYWSSKIKKNTLRDKSSYKTLRQQGFKVLIFWEHDVRNMGQIIKKIKRLIKI